MMSLITHIYHQIKEVWIGLEVGGLDWKLGDWIGSWGIGLEVWIGLEVKGLDWKLGDWLLLVH